jgi:hypothetical protein
MGDRGGKGRASDLQGAVEHVGDRGGHGTRLRLKEAACHARVSVLNSSLRRIVLKEVEGWTRVPSASNVLIFTALKKYPDDSTPVLCPEQWGEPSHLHLLGHLCYPQPTARMLQNFRKQLSSFQITPITCNTAFSLASHQNKYPLRHSTDHSSLTSL